MIRTLTAFFILFLVFISGYFINDFLNNTDKKNVTEKNIFRQKQNLYEKYQLENLKSYKNIKGKFLIKNLISQSKNFESYTFEFLFDPDLDGKNDKKTTGQINIPLIQNESDNISKFPIVLMFRGYINQETYRTGDGTRNASEYFANNGFITVAPDFLGYGGSDNESGDIFEARFQTYITAVSLLNSLNQIDKFNGKNIFIWGHSNGGQIALTTLEITGVSYPTTLWAPVSIMFPYSVLYYTDKSDDRGKLIRSELSKFEKDNDTDKYSLDLYLDSINAPLQIHQGDSDDAVPIEWTNNLVNTLNKLNKKVNYFKYINTDHNMKPNWDIVIKRDITFYLQNINSQIQ